MSKLVMTKKDFRDCVRSILSTANYDVGKEYDEETAEEPDETEERWDDVECSASQWIKIIED